MLQEYDAPAVAVSVMLSPTQIEESGSVLAMTTLKLVTLTVTDWVSVQAPLETVTV